MNTFKFMGMTLVAAALCLGYTSCGDDDDDENSPIANESTSENSGGGSNTGVYNSHEYVDLGLSVKWATCNVSANSPSDYGDYFAWGETTTKSSYTVDNCATYGVSLGIISGDEKYDAARANWGGTWRMPNSYEIMDLMNYCVWEWTTMNGHNGYKVTGINGNSIFLPAAGSRDETSLYDNGERGYYWSSSPYLVTIPGSGWGPNQTAYFLEFYDNGDIDCYWDTRDEGHSVRPVSY